MRGPRRTWAACRLAVLVLLLASGCWTPCALLVRGDPPGAGRVPALTGIEPDPAAGGASAADSSREMAQKLADAEQERLRLAGRVQELEALLADKDRALAQAGQDAHAGADAVARARSDLQRWQQELADLRSRVAAVEKEHLTTLQTVVSALERAVEHDKQPAPAPGQH